MIRIAVCDGRPSFSGMIGKTLFEWKNERGLDVEYYVTRDSDDLIDLCTRRGHMDLILMALHPAGGSDGPASARSLKRADENLRIVFVTAERQIDIELLNLQPRGFLALPVDATAVRMYADACVEDSRRFFIFSYGHGRTAVETDQICYISKKDYPQYRVMDIYCNNGISYMSYMSVKDVEAELKRTGTEFIRIQNSCFVNPLYIIYINRVMLRLRQDCSRGEAELYFSRRFGGKAYRSYIEYAGRNIDRYGIALCTS